MNQIQNLDEIIAFIRMSLEASEMFYTAVDIEPVGNSTVTIRLQGKPRKRIADPQLDVLKERFENDPLGNSKELFSGVFDAATMIATEDWKPMPGEISTLKDIAGRRSHGVCPDCHGTRVIQLLNSTVPCKTCGGG